MSVSVGSQRLTRPAQGAQPGVGLHWREAGTGLAVVGWLTVVAGLGTSIAAAVVTAQAGSEATLAALMAVTVGLILTGVRFGMAGIGLVLWGIIKTIRARVDALRVALPALRRVDAESVGDAATTSGTTPYGRYTVTTEPRPPLPVHRMAEVMAWPMLLMGLMGTVAGFVVSTTEAHRVTTDPALAHSLGFWTTGTLFLSSGLLLGGISFFLGTILSTIRRGGGEIQHSLLVRVKTLRMPLAAKLFIGLMITGLMLEVAQFGASVYLASLGHTAANAAGDAGIVATYGAWLGPFQFFGLGVMLAGIVLALATIAKALGFQFLRVREIITTGR